MSPVAAYLVNQAVDIALHACMQERREIADILRHGLSRVERRLTDDALAALDERFNLVAVSDLQPGDAVVVGGFHGKVGTVAPSSFADNGHYDLLVQGDEGDRMACLEADQRVLRVSSAVQS